MTWPDPALQGTGLKFLKLQFQLMVFGGQRGLQRPREKVLLLTANAANFEASTPLSRFLVGISSSPIFMMSGYANSPLQMPK